MKITFDINVTSYSHCIPEVTVLLEYCELSEYAMLPRHFK